MCWADLCDDLQVVDVPGDHFSLLRQEPADMALLVTSLKAHLGACGWAESVRRDRRMEGGRMSAQVGAAAAAAAAAAAVAAVASSAAACVLLCMRSGSGTAAAAAELM